MARSRLILLLCLLLGLGTLRAASSARAGEPAAFIAPPPRYAASAAYDPLNRTIVLFGGYGSAGILGDTWTWDGLNWTQQFPPISPPARHWANAAFDPQTGTVLLFGGGGRLGAYLSDTWMWDGVTWAELASDGAGVSPPGRDAAAMTYDAATKTIVLFGGHSGAGVLNDTWTWDGASWSEQCAQCAPPARHGPSMAYDPRAQTVLLFGGDGRAGVLNDTWTWDGASWTEQCAQCAPPPRHAGGMTYDPLLGAVLLFGGNGASGVLGDTWAWDGGIWTLECSSCRPPARHGASLVYDPTVQADVLFGGGSIGGGLNDTWLWEGGAWVLQSPGTAVVGSSPAPGIVSAAPAAGPSVDCATASATDRGATGACCAPGASVLGDTWIWDGSAWSVPSGSGGTAGPSARSAATLAYDPATSSVVLFGGCDASGHELGDTWTWDGSAWTLQSTGGGPASPPPRHGAAMAYNLATSALVLFGGASAGDTLGDTWTWEGSAWTEQCGVCGPTPRRGAGLAPDPNQSNAVLFGGNDASGTPLADTWTWDGIVWTPQQPITNPPARAGASTAYDAPLSAVVVFGGSGSGADGLLNDIWAWDGSTWTPQNPGTSPAPRLGASFTFDAAMGSDVLVGGCCDASGAAFGDMWLWRRGAWSSVDGTALPPARFDAGLAVDSIQGTLLLFGGANGGAAP